jgi:hypothetical protein
MVGAFVGALLSRFLMRGAAVFWGSIVVAFIGAVIVVASTRALPGGLPRWVGLAPYQDRPPRPGWSVLRRHSAGSGSVRLVVAHPELARQQDLNRCTPPLTSGLGPDPAAVCDDDGPAEVQS